MMTRHCDRAVCRIRLGYLSLPVHGAVSRKILIGCVTGLMKPRIVAAIGASARYGLIPLLALVALGAWALSSPVGASPDEDYHLTSIWCGQGIEAGQCEAADAPSNRKIPASLLYGPKCFAFHPETSAQCQSRWFSPEPD